MPISWETWLRLQPLSDGEIKNIFQASIEDEMSHDLQSL